ncbi:CoA-binding protein [Kordiimonas sediminis]|uniref:CoA-binding protein n=1 Tax=Kordiimonas sediminis TaxID=1735581 RepID=A0A919E3P7_9PROT|nr:CoA-binding protein [Kordiimonas sediminis]GHF10821.1 CoA-binding protein [Kordiimonas sediminis]
MNDADIAHWLKKTKTIALVGASPNVSRPSNRVLKFLLQEGYDVYPVNPGHAGKSLHGREIFPNLHAIPKPVDMVDVFRQSDALPGIVEDSIAIGAPLVWTQLGVKNADAEHMAAKAGVTMIIDRCPAIEIPRLRRLGLF